jgi:hypothetical protein
LLFYLRTTRLCLGLLIDYGVLVLKDRIAMPCGLHSSLTTEVQILARMLLGHRIIMLSDLVKPKRVTNTRMELVTTGTHDH